MRAQVKVMTAQGLASSTIAASKAEVRRLYQRYLNADKDHGILQKISQIAYEIMPLLL